MLIMPANNRKAFVHYWAGRLPGKLGHIHSPGNKIIHYPWLPYALDNGRFVATTKGQPWDEDAFYKHIRQAVALPTPPLWLVVPDVWGDAAATLAEWAEWAPKLRFFDIPLAFCVQDGITPDMIPDSADILFIGGSDQWRYSRLSQYVSLGLPVHVGRVNHAKYLWACHHAGVTSCDGTGWFRGDKRQTAALEHYLEFCAGSHKFEQLPLLTQ